MKISGYNISVQPGRIIFRANALRLFQGFLGKGLAIPLSVFLFLVAHHMWSQKSFWGLTIAGLLALVCITLSLIPELLRLEFERAQVTRYATRWGFPIVRKLDCQNPLRIKRSFHTPTKGVFRSVALSITQDTKDFEIVTLSGSSRESLDLQVTKFLALLEKELKIKSELV